MKSFRKAEFGLLAGLALAVTSAFGCSDPYKTPVPTTSEVLKGADGSFAATLQKIPEGDRELVARYMARNALGTMFGGAPLAQVSVREAIAAQVAFEAEQAKKEAAEAAEQATVKAKNAQREAEAKALADKAQAARAAQIKAMDDAVTVAVVSMKSVQGSFAKGVNIKFAIENKSEKELAGIKGVVRFKDIFGKDVKVTRIAYDKNIKPKATAAYSGGIEINQFMEGDVKLYDTPMEKLKISWEPEVYLYADGSKLESQPE
jgi:phosphoserine phosphatase